MTFEEFKKFVLDKTGAGVYRYGEQSDGRCNASCTECGGDIYLSLKPDKKGVSYRYCDCD